MSFVKSKMIDFDLNLLAKHLNEICEDKNLTGKDMALRLDVVPSTFQRYTSGKVAPSAEVFVGLHHQNIDLNWFVSGKGEMYRSELSNEIRECHSSYGVDTLPAELLDRISSWWSTASQRERMWLLVSMERLLK